MDKLKIRRYRPSDNPVVWELHRLGLAEIGVKPTPDNPLDQDLKDIENVYLKGGDFIVGEFEADPLEKKLSSTSPICKALLGRNVGDIVNIEVPAGTLKFKILNINK